MKSRSILLTAIITISIYLTTNTFAQTPSTAKIKWFDFEDAMADGKSKPKKYFLDMYTDWCGWCKKMDASTFVDPVIVEYMNKNFYPIKFNAERKDTVEFKGKKYMNANPTGSRSSHQLAQQLLQGRMSYPSFVFLNESGEIITTVPGFRKADEFEAILHFIAENAYQTKSWEEFKAGFKGSVQPAGN
jgi:thioredoxin-related protein